MLKYVQLNRLKLNGALEEFSITLQFLGSKMQKKNEENKGFESSFLRIEVKVDFQPLYRLKNTKPLNVCLYTFFMIFKKKMLIFYIF